MRAETLQTDVSAIGSLSIFCRFAGQEHERAWTSDNYRPQWSTAHCLAVCAVANGRRFGIGFGLERHVAAVTASINFHDRFPGIPQIGLDDSWFPDRADTLLRGSDSVTSRCRLHVRFNRKWTWGNVHRAIRVMRWQYDAASRTSRMITFVPYRGTSSIR
jgi:hypothetical protein